jgi:hypothetical protein
MTFVMPKLLFLYIQSIGRFRIVEIYDIGPTGERIASASGRLRFHAANVASSVEWRSLAGINPTDEERYQVGPRLPY